MTKVEAKRVLKLADFLRELPRKNFDFNTWAMSKSGEFCKVGDCGTTACVLGWAATMPAFKRLGLHLSFNERTYYDDHGTEDGTYFEASVVNSKSGETGSYAGTEIFGQDSRKFFYPDNDGETHGLGDNATPKQLAKVLVKHVKRQYPELVA